MELETQTLRSDIRSHKSGFWNLQRLKMAVDLNTLFQATGMTPLAVVPEIKHCQRLQRDTLFAQLAPSCSRSRGLSYSQPFTAIHSCSPFPGYSQQSQILS